MNVYSVDSLGHPTGKRFRNYSLLAATDEDWAFLAPTGEVFNGVPFHGRWKMLNLFLEKPLIPRPNFFNFSCRTLVCDKVARDIASEPLEMSCEFLPIKIKGVEGEFQICNVINTINVVDSKKSKWERLGKDENGQPTRRLVRPAFFPDRFGEESIFKIPEDRGTGIYCLERTGNPDDGEFKAVVEKHGLTGLNFELVWSDKIKISRK